MYWPKFDLESAEDVGIEICEAAAILIGAETGVDNIDAETKETKYCNDLKMKRRTNPTMRSVRAHLKLSLELQSNNVFSIKLIEIHVKWWYNKLQLKSNQIRLNLYLIILTHFTLIYLKSRVISPFTGELTSKLIVSKICFCLSKAAIIIFRVTNSSLSRSFQDNCVGCIVWEDPIISTKIRQLDTHLASSCCSRHVIKRHQALATLREGGI